MIRVWIIVIILLILFSGAISSIQTAGKPQLSEHMEQIAPTVSVLQEFEYINTHWCWRGLCLGETTFQEATIRLRDTTIFSDISRITPEPGLAWMWMKDPSLFAMLSREPSNDQLTTFTFAIQSEVFTLIDAMFLFGRPQVIDVQGTSSDDNVYIYGCLAADVCVTVIQPPGALRPDSIISGIAFVTHQSYRNLSGFLREPVPWRGFIDYTPR